MPTSLETALTETEDLQTTLRLAQDRRRIRRILQERLSEKIDNYEREAAKLAVRGNEDAAQVLRRAAANLRSITRQNETAAA